MRLNKKNEFNIIDNEVWENVDEWWVSYEVQNARRMFCEEYARSSRKPIRDLRKLLLEGI